MHSVVIRSIEPEKIERHVRRYAEKLRRDHPEIVRIVWFGSWINGLPVPGSDVDLCLVVSHSDQPQHARASEYLPQGFPTGLDLFVYSLEELERLRSNSPGWYETIQAGIDI